MMSLEDHLFVILRKEANKVKYSWCSCYGNTKNGEINLAQEENEHLFSLILLFLHANEQLKYIYK